MQYMGIIFQLYLLVSCDVTDFIFRTFKPILNIPLWSSYAKSQARVCVSAYVI